MTAHPPDEDVALMLAALDALIPPVPPPEVEAEVEDVVAPPAPPEAALDANDAETAEPPPK